MDSMISCSARFASKKFDPETCRLYLLPPFISSCLRQIFKRSPTRHPNNGDIRKKLLFQMYCLTRRVIPSVMSDMFDIYFLALSVVPFNL